jgi:uncharacterized Zn finger protein
MEIELLAKSTSHPDEPYRVTFCLAGGILTVTCTCPAGEFGQLCKHKVSLALNDSKALFDLRQKDQLEQVSKWVKASSLPDLIGEVKRIEAELEDGKKRLKIAKAKTGKLMTQGVR